MVEKIHIEKFLELAKQYPVLDVRSPAEFTHAHIPGAFSLPLFTDEERKIVGTTYKQQSREAAIKIGLDFFGPKMRGMVEEVEKILDCRFQISDLLEANKSHKNGDNDQITNPNKSEIANLKSKIVLIHCWRGGMRSAGVAWLLDLYGFKVYALTGGYKKYRHWVSDTFSLPFTFKILGGYTGSGKTHVLNELKRQGETVIDLESIAHHKGSAFGAIGQPQQPAQEMFENILANKLSEVRKLDNCQTSELRPQTSAIWLEDESQRIGQVNIPQPLWNAMRQSLIYFMEIPFAKRLDHITEEYGDLDRQRMAEAITRIQKRLGGLETTNALQWLEDNNVRECFRILLTYYDKWYLKGLSNRESLDSMLNKISCEEVNPKKNASKLLTLEKEQVV